MTDTNQETGPAPPAKKREFTIRFLQRGTLSHSLLWTERSGGLLFLILGFFQFVVPLHGIIDWHGNFAWGQATNLALFAFFFVVAGWYPCAQGNAIQLAASAQGAIDPKQVSRDFTWSIVPVFIMGAIMLLTGVGICLLIFTDVLAGPDTFWRDRLIVSPAMLFFILVFSWEVKVDLGNNNSVLTELVQLAGRLMRFERMEH